MLFHLIEDDPVLARGLQVNLELENHKIVISNNLKSALENQLQNKADFIILDLGLPDGSGFEFLTERRNQKDSTPIIILTAQTDEDSVVKGLQLGANDYMKKPYSFKELNARIKVILNKPILDQKIIAFEKLSINLALRTCRYYDANIDLNRREFDILAALVQQAEMIVNREYLITVFNKENEIFDRTIDSHISHLRKKLKASGLSAVKISSIYGLGYRLEKNNEK
ncbi:MAG: response regulator transcription factor [Pseudobdellovibrio sp.]